MVGLRDFYLVSPAASFHPHQEQLLSNSEPNPIIPLLSGAPCFADDDSRASKIQLWQPQPLPSPHPPPPPQNPNSSGILYVADGTSTCQDCGNQAKKDCSHRRCRTCCKSRGFDCSTHIKSTWVPAARRRERHLSAADHAVPSSSPSISALKKPRLISSQTTTTSHASNSNSTGSSHQDPSFRENLPGHVRAPAVFKCVRVTSIDDGEDDYAYHAKVSIGGHVFKGFLYNQGVDDGSIDLTGNSSAVDVNNNNTSTAIPNFSELNLGGVHSEIYGGGGLLG